MPRKTCRMYVYLPMYVTDIALRTRHRGRGRPLAINLYQAVHGWADDCCKTIMHVNIEWQRIAMYLVSGPLICPPIVRFIKNVPFGTCRGRSVVVKACDLQCRRPPQGLPKICTGIFWSSGVA